MFSARLIFALGLLALFALRWQAAVAGKGTTTQERKSLREAWLESGSADWLDFQTWRQNLLDLAAGVGQNSQMCVQTLAVHCSSFADLRSYDNV